MHTPMTAYQQDLDTHTLDEDPAQKECMEYLETIFHALLAQNKKSLFDRLKAKLFRQEESVRGLYVWGDVGRGKTYLMDTFYDCLPIAEKQRLHFHRFMYQVHHKLKQLQDKQVKNPLYEIALEFGRKVRVLCFDEFYVSDVTDAMIMAGLFKALLKQNITLVITSNVRPDDLYRNGVHRDRFLPVIDLLKEHTHVHYLMSNTDYRLRSLKDAEIYHYPLDDVAEENLAKYFSKIAAKKEYSTEIITINSRPVMIKQVTEGVLWCEFDELCVKARSQIDYIELARIYHTVLLSHVKEMKAEDDSTARRFIALVDEFYDRNVKLILSAEVAIDELYKGRQFNFEFQRTQSRLVEMQSEAYLATPHKP